MNKRSMRVLMTIATILVIANLMFYFNIGDNIISKGTTTFQSLLSPITNRSKTDNKSNKDLTSENEKLIAENKLLKSQNEVLNEELATVNVTNVNKSSNIVLGSVIYRNSNDWSNKMTINVGSNDGIKIGDPVTSGGILIGFCEEVDKNNTIVKLNTSENVAPNIPAMAIHDNKEINGIIKEYDAENKQFIFEMMGEQITLTEGDKIYTNGYNQKTDKGILIGQVVEPLEENKNIQSLLAQSTVAPLVDISNVRNIEVIISE